MNPELEMYKLNARLQQAERRARFSWIVAVLSMLISVGVFLLIPMILNVRDARSEARINALVASPPSGAIEATGFVLRDAQGRGRIMMGINPDNSAVFGLMGPTNDSHLAIAAHGDGTLAMAFTQGPLPAITLSATPKGEAGILVGTNHKVGITTATDFRGASVLVQGEDGQIIGKLP